MFLGGMVFRIGPALVVEIMEEAGEGPKTFVAAKLQGVGADAGFDRQGVFAEAFALREFAEKGPGIRAIRHLFSSPIGHILAEYEMMPLERENDKQMGLGTRK